MKNGLFFEDGKLMYYKNDCPEHAGAIRVDGDIYYINSHGCAVKGQYIVHGEMTNGILKRGTYTFGDDYKLINGSYIPPKSRSRHKKFLSKKRRQTVLIVSTVLIMVFLAALFRVERSGLLYNPPTNVPSHSGQQNQDSALVISLPTFDEDVLLCSPAALRVFENAMTIDEAKRTGTPYRPFIFDYIITDSPGTLRISEQEDLSNAREYVLEPTENSISIDNLKTGTEYYYQFTLADEVYTGTFHTARSTRFVSIPGVENTRDIGGYETLDGKMVRQELLIRGTEMDGLVNTAYLLPKDSAEEIQNTFGFVYDMDLRSSTTYAGTYYSPLGRNVTHKFYDAPAYGEIFQESAMPAMRAIFADLADPNKYPMYLHCTWGADRTGTIVFLLQGILNMSEEDMIREYRLTGFSHSGYDDANTMDVVIGGLEPYEGDTLQEKIITYLTTTVGVTEGEIESIRNIFLED